MKASHNLDEIRVKVKGTNFKGCCFTVFTDAVIHFCHWGCKQASGGSILLKEKMKELGIPMLILDGDGIDRRNSHDGQIKTRLEAFLEILDEEDGNAVGAAVSAKKEEA